MWLQTPCAQHWTARLTLTTMQAQTPEQRRRNAQFAKKNEAKMGKSEEQLRKKVEKVQKSPISMFWIGTLHGLPNQHGKKTCAYRSRRHPCVHCVWRLGLRSSIPILRIVD
jgi:hypothetical protein